MRLMLSVMAGLMLAACNPATENAEPVAEAPEVAAPGFERVDYADMDTWLCHPGKSANDACAVDLTATVIEEDGSTRLEAFEAAAEPAFDCFYFYPTVSLDETPNSDMSPGPEELNVIANQFARYGLACRLYAPIYRQATLQALRMAVLTGTSTADPAMIWADITDSWNHYLEHENNGRGVILAGHSQGAGLILRLLKQEIIGTPVEARIISAHPIGTVAHVDPDGTFGGMPVCAAGSETGCVVSFVSFRADAEPPAASRFGKVAEDGRRSICASPQLLAGRGNALDAYMPSRGLIAADDGAPFDYGAAVETPFVKLPGLLSGECRSNATHDWLAMTINAGNGPRADDIPGDVIVAGQVLADWGLHLIDVNIAMGDLVELARMQAAAWERNRQEP
ncbi:DUF3089 domain-containing protein [Hyphomonas sp.]|uniref:DUF3089 domain-containing protein n=1 Tax=Hyphomonas sp. TaxID=87 RepID=UPI00391A6A28